MNKLLEMFLTFFKIGAFTFGGGWAMLPIMEREFVVNKKWVSKEDFIDIIVLSQSFPGAMAVNASTFIGNKLFGIRGAVIALSGVCLPSLIIIIIIAAFFQKFRSNFYVDLGMRGINAAVPALILIATISLIKNLKKTYFNFVVAIISSLVLIAPSLLDSMGINNNLPKVHPLIVLIIGALLGIFKYRNEPLASKEEK